MDFQVPSQLETDRILLRQFEENDWQDLHKYYSDPVATKYTTGQEFTEEQTWRNVSMMIGHWQLRGYGPYAAVEKKSQKVMGAIGFWYPLGWPSPEIMWSLSSDYWGKGYASEATRKVQKTGSQYLPHISLISFIHPDNSASINLAEAVGAQFEKTESFRGKQWPIYRHPK
ncbi:MAG: N-acetyltransferase [Gammaproteobacteria bacterium]|nr:MAG: N-acetyltransferase [Gammaproteobacteria bacterium]